MRCEELENYLSVAKGLPFFYILGDRDYHDVLTEFRQSGIAVVRMSDFCRAEDKFPSVDDLVDYFRTLDVDCRDNKCVVVGLGEYLALRGLKTAKMELGRLKDITLGTARVILLLRGISDLASDMVRNDKKIQDQQRAYIDGDAQSNISITVVPPQYGILKEPGMKKLIHDLEDGKSEITASTRLILDNSSISVHTLQGAYSVVKWKKEDFCLEESLGTEEQWQQFLEEFSDADYNMETVFSNNSVDDEIFKDSSKVRGGTGFRSWLAFLYLKMNVSMISNSYLQSVVESTQNYMDLNRNILLKITEFNHKNRNFDKMYRQRKVLLKGLSNEALMEFVKINETYEEESIYHLTDNTLIEKQMIIKYVVRYGYNDAMPMIYPALAQYLGKYKFHCSAFENELTEYFDSYKHQKIANRISDDFLSLVEKYAPGVIYAQLPSRDGAIKEIADKKHVFLYWIDALGVEYLSYITELASQNGLSVNVKITRANLPTITCANKGFYEQWPFPENKFKEEELDDIKHKEKGGYSFTNDADPIHIPRELDVIERAINFAKAQLESSSSLKSVVIASDHGASRLAVIQKHEIPYETDTKGEHSGRCCKFFEGCDVPHKIEENGYIVLSDYGRFRGSRAANVEVHGGASLEELIVPVITLRKRTASAKTKVLRPDDIVADRRNGVTLYVDIPVADFPNDISLQLNDNRYPGQLTDTKMYKFCLKDLKRAGNYKADIFDGENLIDSIEFKAKGKTAIIKDDFDFD